MCGISGEISFGASASDADWQQLSDLMYQRGPDDGGHWTDGICTLVFRRLSILDLTPTGHQPMRSADNRYVIVFNGEVYNFPEIRRDLEQRGIKFRSSGDTEVVLYALITWGVDALDKLNGMFALGFYDSQAKRLLLARDHAGIKPLYYVSTPSGIAFGSQYDQILAHPWARHLGLSEDALALYLRLAFIPAPFAVLDDTHMLPAGTWRYISSDGSSRSGRYYSFPQHAEPELRGEEAFEAVEAAVGNAVRRQLVSDVPLGAFLSGGIDSPLVVAKMKQALASGVHTFTIGTGDGATDESADAINYARSLGVEQTIEQVTPQTALDLLEDITGAVSEPFGDYSIFPTMLVSKLARKQHTVMLSGDGGDELFWGYPKRAAPIIRGSRYFRYPRMLRMLMYVAGRITHSAARHDFLRSQSSVGQWHLHFHRHLPEAQLRKIFPGLPSLPDHYEEYDFNEHDQDLTAQWLRWNEFVSHLTMVLMKVDRASMHHALEVRVPLLDREVIDVAMRVNWQSCLDTETQVGKIPLRKALAKHTDFQTTAKRGFEVPMNAWLRSSLKDVFHDELLAKNELLGLEIDRKGFAAVYDQHLNGQRDYAWGLWPLLSLALWKRRHFSG